jgi:hypothetical protein
MPTRDDILSILRATRPSVEDRYPIRLLGLVGSAARGEMREDSDIDVLAESLPGLTLFKLGAVSNILEDALGRHVDILLADGLKPRILEDVRRDLRPL